MSKGDQLLGRFEFYVGEQSVYFLSRQSAATRAGEVKREAIEGLIPAENSRNAQPVTYQRRVQGRNFDYTVTFSMVLWPRREMFERARVTYRLP